MIETSYAYNNASLNCHHHYLLPKVLEILQNLQWGTERRVLDLGCGSGVVSDFLHKNGFQTVGVEPSESGIAQAKAAFPHLEFHEGSAYDDLPKKFGQFPAVVSLEVVEHVYFPRKFASTLYALLPSGGTAVISTPFHGYWKNLAIALAGKMDVHLDPLWDHGHIKFWSIPTLRRLLEEAGFRKIRFERVGRFPALAKSMIAIATKD